jgi:hypothetical protein
MPKKQRTPLALSDEMVAALLDGRKRMTVRALNERDYRFWQDEDDKGWPVYEDDFGDTFRAPSPYGPKGSHLWVRESYRLTDDSVEYRQQTDPDRKTENSEWLPVVGMPESFSRLRLKITRNEFRASVKELTDEEMQRCGFSGPDIRLKFKRYWNKRYRNRFQKWEQSPPIWVVKFKLLTRKTP